MAGAASPGDAGGPITAPAGYLTAAIERVFAAAGCPPAEASLIAGHLVDANLAGHDSHGLMRVTRYLGLLERGKVHAGRHVEAVVDHGPVAILDGRFGFGQSIATEAMEIAAGKAAEAGFAIVGLRNSGHLGRIGAWAEHLAGRGFVSLHFANSSGYSILVAPHGGSDRRLSSNPMAAGVPRPGKAPIILDMATSAIAEGKVQVARNRREKLAPGQILDGHGRPSLDSESFYADPRGALLPFGGHKGYALSVLCEILAGSLTGGWASNPASPTADRLANNMLTIVIDPQSLAGQAFFAADVARLTEWLCASPPLDPAHPVMLPGEIEARTREQRRAAGIPIDAETWAGFTRAAATVGIKVEPPPQPSTP